MNGLTLEIRLSGCGAEPLASYMKALAVLRLVSEQKDPEARGHWTDAGFVLQTRLTAEEIVAFFADEYVPTPIAAPWNGFNGFMEGEDRTALDAILSDGSPRLAEYRETIEKICAIPEVAGNRNAPMREMIAVVKGKCKDPKDKKNAGLVEDLAKAFAAGNGNPDVLSLTHKEIDKAGVPKSLGKAAKKLLTAYNKVYRSGGAKGFLIPLLRNTLCDRAVEWIDAVVVISPVSRKDGLFYPPILGSGGNDGNAKFSLTFMEYIGNMLVSTDGRKNNPELLRNALFGDPTDLCVAESFGQFHPGATGGFNMGCGIEAKKVANNPWDFILCMEGTVAWSSGVSRRTGKEWQSPALSCPFTVNISHAGYASACRDEDAKAEVWTPLWSKPARYAEIRSVIAEGRADVGGQIARDGLDLARAAASFGVDRGIREFTRYNIVARRGKSNIATATGRIRVRETPEAALLFDLDRPMGSIRAYIGDGKDKPARLKSAQRAIEEAIYAMLMRGDPDSVQQAVAAIGRMEKALSKGAHGDKKGLSKPPYGLSPRWILAADNGNVEVRLAAACATIHGRGGVGPLRANVSPVNPERYKEWAKGGAQTAWTGASLPDRLLSVLRRRMMDADRLGADRNPLYSPVPLLAEDVASYVDGSVDEGLLEDLIFGFLWLRRQTEGDKPVYDEIFARWKTPARRACVTVEYAVLKLLYLDRDLALTKDEHVRLRQEPGILPLLACGRLRDAMKIAERRLFSAGLPATRAEFHDTANARRIGAGLLFPVRNPRYLAPIALGERPKR